MKVLGKINYIDNEDKSLGISLPFNGPSVFNRVYSTKDQIKNNLINLLLTYKGEKLHNPEFGADLVRLLFEPINGDLNDNIRSQIINNVSIFIPQVRINDIDITNNEDNNYIGVKIKYTITTSNTNDEVNIEING